MGILCQSCNSFRINLDPEKSNETNKKLESELPKQYLHIQDEENKTSKEDISITQQKVDDNFDFLKNKAKSVLIKEKDINNDKDNKTFLKSKSMKMIERNSKKSHSLKLF